MTLLEYMGRLIATAVNGQFSTDAPLTGNLPVMLGDLSASFPRGIGLMPYAIENGGYLARDTEGFQVRYRGTFAQVMNMKSKVFDNLQGLHRPETPPDASFQVEQVLRMSSGSLGYDANKRLNWTENYYVQVWQSTRHRL